ncbi:MAG: poly(A) polymerase [Deltaproteobacteria bacterium]|nr:poly(A) polymerase [Deltaproteobacteria bacterium]MBW1933189.1 poly(A) polymerase [Deltaproteobacteria bacterium]MBW1939197.1 poly(A) polymerase [Deltaproteobacteria bacterium]MBW1965265.1 poly(A) polymerase [Deltaproteobacteria bacterium]MBW2080045.1 poly(A) polymerase [Deltaproteobacteria bacterium]
MSKSSLKANKYSRRKRFCKKRSLASAQPAKFLPAEQPSLFADPGNHPRIIPRPEHCVSRKDIDREALKVLYCLKDNGYIAYLVGGSVRDLLLGRRPKDFDVGTNARPEDLKKLFRHSRIIGRRFRLVHVYFRGGQIIEVSTFRCRSYHDDLKSAGEGIGDIHIFGSPQEDAFRRDLTINGLFYNIADFSIIDYVGGMADLKQGNVRFIGNDPEHRCLKDPVRMLRAVRHAARTGFTIETNTWESLLRHSDRIRLCAISRVRDEWLKDLRSGYSRPWAEFMIKAGLFASVFSGYVSAFESKDKGLVRKLLFGLLGHLDRMVNDGIEVSEALMLALFAYPRLCVTPEWKALKVDRLKWPTHEVRSLLGEVLTPYDFRRSVRDVAAQILASQWNISICLAKGKWPKRVWNKATFRESIMFYDLVQEALGQPVVGPDPHLRPRPKPLKKFRTRKRRSPATSRLISESEEIHV